MLKKYSNFNCKKNSISSAESITNRRTYYYDILRIIACLLVIINHSEAKVFMNISISATWIVSMFKFFACKVAVPIFLMISGALLLGKEENYKKTLWRVFRMVLLVSTFSLLFSIIYSHNIPNMRNLISFCVSLIKRPYYTAYWYIYTLIGIYIMTPIIKKMVRNMSEKDYIYFFTIWALYIGVLPIIQNYINIQITSYFNLSIFNVYIGYYILGYYLSNKKYDEICNIKSVNYILLIIIPIIINLFLTCLKTMGEGNTSLFLDGYQFITVMVSSASLFCIIRKKYENIIIKNKVLGKSIIEFGKCTFGIYLIHVYMIDKTNEFIYSNLIAKGMNYEISVTIQQISVFIMATVLIYVIRRIPIVNKII